MDLQFVKEKIKKLATDKLKINFDTEKDTERQIGYAQALKDLNEEILQYEKLKHIPKFQTGNIVFLLHQKSWMVINYYNNSGELKYNIRSGVSTLSVYEFELTEKQLKDL